MSASTTSIRDRLAILRVGPIKPVTHVLAGLFHLGLVVVCVLAWDAGWWALSVLLWGVIVWVDHAALVRLHESAHRMLFRNLFFNEAAGIIIGTLSLTPLSVYRHVHTQHHAHLGREKDPEFWPYNQPDQPRSLRLLYAWTELIFGWIFTPWLYSSRTANAWDTFPKHKRNRLIVEWIGMIVFWIAVLIVVAVTHTWTWFLVGHLAPTWIAGSVQTVRKFTEHLGRFGETIPAMTRTVVYTGPLGRAASHSQLHVEHHGTHHRWPKIPYHKLPVATDIVSQEQADFATYSSHYAAVRDMLPWLVDPKLGPQWQEAGKT